MSFLLLDLYLQRHLVDLPTHMILAAIALLMRLQLTKATRLISNLEKTLEGASKDSGLKRHCTYDYTNEGCRERSSFSFIADV